MLLDSKFSGPFRPQLYLQPLPGLAPAIVQAEARSSEPFDDLNCMNQTIDFEEMHGGRSHQESGNHAEGQNIGVAIAGEHKDVSDNLTDNPGTNTIAL